jgi:hypothetical protein
MFSFVLYCPDCYWHAPRDAAVRNRCGWCQKDGLSLVSAATAEAVDEFIQGIEKKRKGIEIIE